MHPRIEFRPASMEDADLLLVWRNDPLTRAMSHTTAPIDRAQHQSWLRTALQDATRRIMIALMEGRPIGTIRCDRQGDGGIVSWTMAPEARGKGLGKHMVRQFCENEPGALKAEVKADNEASKRIALFAGFHLVRQDGDVLHYERPVSDR